MRSADARRIHDFDAAHLLWHSPSGLPGECGKGKFLPLAGEQPSKIPNGFWAACLRARRQMQRWGSGSRRASQLSVGVKTSVAAFSARGPQEECR